MILVYRPELQNPPMAPESTVSFTLLGENGNHEYVQLIGGVNRDFPEAVWDRIKDYDVVKNLLSIGAVRITEEDSPEVAAVEAPNTDGIANLSLTDALDLIENSFNLEQLKKWDAKENRIRVKNAIAKRLEAITKGNG